MHIPPVGGVLAVTAGTGGLVVTGHGGRMGAQLEEVGSMGKDSCEGCQHWERIDQNAEGYEYAHNGEVGYCHVDPAPIVIGDIAWQGTVTTASWWCCAHQPRAEAEATPERKG